ncbi:hypothetical protein M2273_005198 [Mucilaginibacter lappiensis]
MQRNGGPYSAEYSHKDLELWIRDKFKDLDNIEFQEDVAILLNDPNIGFTEADRKSRIRKARNICIIYGIGLIIPATGIFFFFDMKILDIIMLIYPLLAIPIMLTSNGLIRFYIKKNSPFFTTYITVYISSIALFIRSADSNHVIRFSPLLLPCLTIGLVYCLFLNLAARGKVATTTQPTKMAFFVLILAGLIFAAGSSRTLNCTFDNSAEQQFQATILNRNITHNKGTTHYHLTISTWGPQTNVENITVSESTYNKHTEGSAITVYLKKGLLNTPWYFVSQ